MPTSANRVPRSVAAIVTRLAPYGLAAAILIAVRPADADAIQPLGSAVGNVRAVAGIPLYLGFSAAGTPTSASGAVTYVNGSGKYFAGDVTCYYQSGKEAGISGTVTASNYGALPAYFFIQVSQTANAVQVADPTITTKPNCANLAHNYPGKVTAGTMHVGS